MLIFLRRALAWKFGYADSLLHKRRSKGRKAKLRPVRLNVEFLEVRNLLSGASLGAAYGQVPLSFEPNLGQTNSQVSYLSQGSGYTLFLNSHEAVLSLQPGQPDATSVAVAKSQSPSVLQMELIGANPAAAATGLERQASISNYFLGNNPSQWVTNVPNYAQVQYQGVYPGVDLIYYGNQTQLEYDFRIAPGADPSDIQLHFAGAQDIALDSAGDLLLQTAGGDVVEHAPVLYQEVNGRRQAVAGSYVVEANGQVGFQVGPYDTTQELIIDPVLSYSTYLGGSSTDAGVGFAVDSAGEAYVSGYTESTNFPIVNGFQNSLGSATQVAFVAKLNAAGTALVYSTFLGGNGTSDGVGLALDSSGDAYVTGFTTSSNFPTVNAIQSSNPSQYSTPETGFVAKLNPTGSALVYSTYLGGNGQHGPDQSVGIAVDSSGNVYIDGITGSTNFPLVNAYQTTNAGVDVFVAEIDAAGTALAFSTYLGSGGGYCIAVDSTGAIYVCGATNGPDFPITPTAIQPFFGGAPGSTDDAFVTKLSPGGASLVYSTFLGGSDDDYASGITVDSAGEAYVAGSTYSTDFPTVNAFQSTQPGSENEFVAKINAVGTALIYSTYLGGSNYAFAGGIAVDSAGDAYVVGGTDAANFPTANPIQATNHDNGGLASYNAFISELDPVGATLAFSTYLGGSVNDSGVKIALDSSGNVYVTGYTSSPDFPTVNPLQANNAGGQDGFISKITMLNSNPVPVVKAPSNQSAGQAIADSVSLGFFSEADVSGAWNVDVNWGDGTSDTRFSVNAEGALGTQTHTYAAVGTDTVTVTVTDPSGKSAFATFSVSVFAPPVLTPPSNQTAGQEVSAALGLGSFSQPGVNGPWNVAVNWGDGAANTTFIALAQGSLGTKPHTFSAPGTDTVTVSVTDPYGNTSSDTFTVAVAANSPPVITSVPSTTFIAGNPDSFVVSATGFPTPTLAENGHLPSGITFDAATGLLSGTPAADVNGAFAITFTASNGVGSDATQSFTLTVLGPTNLHLLSSGNIATGNGPIAIASGDFNGDGKIDIAVVNYLGNSVTVFLNTGNGAFAVAQTLVTGLEPDSIVAGNFNGDGKIDLAVANAGSGTVSAFLGNGNGTFAAAQVFVAGSDPTFSVLGDFNHDGNIDLAVANYQSGTISILLGNGNGTFRGAQTVNSGTYPSAIALGDFNGDGKIDLAVTNAKNDIVSVLLGNGNGKFQPAQLFATGSTPDFVATGDFNGDGKIDLAVADKSAGTVSVLLGNGNGTFQAKHDYITASQPIALVVADLNGDGRTDLAVANGGGNTAGILLGNGNGSFQSFSAYAAGSDPMGIAAADVNGDGRPDLLIANYAGNSFTSLLNTFPAHGSPPLQPKQDFTTNTQPSAVTLADVNGDGKLDLIVANSGSNTVSVLLGNGNGTFGARQDFITGNNPSSVVAADVNGDGKLDLITVNKAAGTVSVLLGNGDGTFAAKQDNHAGSQPLSVAAADLNGDGKPDLVTANSFNDTVSVLLGNSSGNFEYDGSFTTGGDPHSVVAADVNGDGKLDLITANYGDFSGSGSVSVLLGNGNGTFQAQHSFTTGGYTVAVAVADVNGDGKLDLIAANSKSSTVSVLLGNGNGTFAAKQDFTTGSSPSSVAVADVNGDGKLDLIVTNSGSSTVSVLLGNGNGTFAAKQDFTTGSSPSSVAVADVNDDGRLDIAAASSSGTVSVLLGNNPFQGPLTASTSAHPFQIVAGDLNGDGKVDLVSANNGANSVSVLLGNADGSFKTEQDFVTGLGPRSVALGDVNGDGKTDIVTANFTAGTVSVLLGNGDGTFLAAQSFAVGTQPRDVTLADVNGDGKLDIVVANRGSNTVSVLMGNGNGTFKNQQLFSVDAMPYSVRVADVNGDGKPDVVVADYGNNTVSVLLGNGDGTFKAKQDFATGQAPYVVRVSDLNGDGKLDLAVINYRDGTVSVLLGNGDGTFKAKQDFVTGYRPTALTVGDVNFDGIPDLIVGNGAAGTISVLLGNGNGTFQAKQDFAVGVGPAGILLADVNGDGRQDLVTTGYFGSQITVLLGGNAPP